MEIGIVKTACRGMAVDPKGNVLLYNSKNNDIGISGGNIGVSGYIKSAILPGIQDVRDMMGQGVTFNVNAGVGVAPGTSQIGMSISAEVSGTDKFVGMGLSAWAGPNFGGSVSWSCVPTYTTAIAMTANDFKKIESSTSWNKAYATAQNWNSKTQNAGIWEVGDITLDYIPVEGKNNMYQAIVKTDYLFKPFTGVNATQTQIKQETGVYFIKQEDGSFVSTDFKPEAVVPQSDTSKPNE